MNGYRSVEVGAAGRHGQAEDHPGPPSTPGAAVQDYVNDLYAPLAHIPELRDSKRPRWVQSWVSLHDTRRLAAYKVLGS